MLAPPDSGQLRLSDSHRSNLQLGHVFVVLRDHGGLEVSTCTCTEYLKHASEVKSLPLLLGPQERTGPGRSDEAAWKRWSSDDLRCGVSEGWRSRESRVPEVAAPASQMSETAA